MKRSGLRDAHNRLETETKILRDFRDFGKTATAPALNLELNLTQKAELARVDDTMITNRLILLFFIFKSSSESLEELEKASHENNHLQFVFTQNF